MRSKLPTPLMVFVHVKSAAVTIINFSQDRLRKYMERVFHFRKQQERSTLVTTSLSVYAIDRIDRKRGGDEC